MKLDDLRALLGRVASRDASIDEAVRDLATLPFEDLGFARVDHHRELRTGMPEVVFGATKTADEIARIVESIVSRNQAALVTRVAEETATNALARVRPELRDSVSWNPLSRLMFGGARRDGRGRGFIAVVTAGTSDRAIAEEAAQTAEFLGQEVRRFFDVGVAGLHRVVAIRNDLEDAEVIVAVAGMEGALPGVLKGLVSRPVIAVPTSVGGAMGFFGITALLGMLASCAPGMTTVSIDNGFGAGYAAALMNAKRPAEGERHG